MQPGTLVRPATLRPAGRRPAGRRLIAVCAALVAVILIAGPVAAAEHYRSTTTLRLTGTTTKYGVAYLDRYFGGSPVGPTKTTLRVVASKLAPSASYSIRIGAGVCESEGYVLVSLAARSTSAGRMDRTLTLTTSQRRKVQQAYDSGSPLIVMMVRGDLFLCGNLGNPRLIR